MAACILRHKVKKEMDKTDTFVLARINGCADNNNKLHA